LSDHRFFAALPDYKLPQRILPWDRRSTPFSVREAMSPNMMAQADSRFPIRPNCAHIINRWRTWVLLTTFVPSFYVSCQRDCD